MLGAGTAGLLVRGDGALRCSQSGVAARVQVLLPAAGALSADKGALMGFLRFSGAGLAGPPMLPPPGLHVVKVSSVVNVPHHHPLMRTSAREVQVACRVACEA